MTTHHTAQGLASLGRHGDTMLVHMSPHEVAGLNYLAKKQGTKLTVNPETGLPEAFSLGGLFSSILPMFAGAMFPGAGFAMEPLLAGALTGGVLAGVKGENPLMGGIMGGLGGMSGSNLAFGLSGAANPASSLAQAANTTAGGYTTPLLEASKIAGVSGPQLPGAALANTGLQSGQSMMMSPVVRNAVQAAQTSGGILPNTGSFMSNELTALSNAGKGAGNLITGQPGSWQGFKDAFIDPKTGTGALTDFGAATKIAMPVGGAILGGLEPSDLYGEPIDMAAAKQKEKYDPTRSLNLSGDTGLRLYAEGGTIQPSITTGGIRDLYGSSDNQTQALSSDGFGLGRLSNLANQQAMTTAKTLGYAMGGPISFADGGDSNKEDAMGLPSLSPDMSMNPSAEVNNAAMLQNVMGAMQPMQNMQGNTLMAQGQTPAQTNDSLIAKVTANLKSDPNYQPTNPIEASIVKQLKGTDPLDISQQGLGSIAPSQPMAPSYNPSVAMGPTYFAGMNAPRGMAKGGYLNGQGDGMSDSIPATIEGKQPARLADGEFVVPADVVSHIGNGSSKAGSQRLYSMLDRVRKARTGHTKQGKEIKPEKYMPA
jgi:hypothetical protein